MTAPDDRPAEEDQPAEEAAGLSTPPGDDQSDVVTLVVWRHGQTTYNAQQRFQGQTDVPLNDAGRRQAERAAPFLAAMRPSAIYSSDLSRATATAEALARLTGLPVQLDKDLRERFGGAWEGLTDAEIRERYPAERVSWTPPDGEPSAAVEERAAAALERIAGSLPGGSLAVVVGHGAAMAMAVARVLRVPSQPRVLGPFGNCHWSVLSRRGTRWRLLEHNVGVLPEPPGPPAEADRGGA